MAWIPKELKAALNYRKPIIPFRIDIQYTDISDDFDLACADLPNQIRAMLNTGSR